MRTARSALPALILATAALLASPPLARAGFAYTYSLTGTITEVSDLSTIRSTGEPIHLLPGLEVSDPITATGTITGSFATDGYAYITAASMAVEAPGDFRFAISSETTTSGGLFDPTQPDAGFSLWIGGLFDSEHPAVAPTLWPVDFVHDVSLIGPSLSVSVDHSSRQLTNLHAFVGARFTTIATIPVPESDPPSVATVPEPGAWGLLAVGLAGAWAGRRVMMWRTG